MRGNENPGRVLRPAPVGSCGSAAGFTAHADDLLQCAGRGDSDAFAALYDLLASRVFGLVRRVLRDPAQSEEVTQEVFVEVWRTAARFEPAKGSASAWVYTLAHRRAVDRVRSSQAATERERRVAILDYRDFDGFDDVVEQVEARLEHEHLRQCLNGLTTLQRQSITLAYYRGYTYREVAELLKVPVGTVKTRMRDSLIRLRDCLGIGR
ncbi:sigma-70 family RNA polymerase sigma factor [Frankia sp. Cppng1_Ct_nod]|uniref:sigma-70 family RNA polymerase sigma factor n=1 Tax=Frankia sp. Cppng1_Ct_nod TaxID=2897162 RepID=UPI001040F5EB|nr:sigma-70 family RNA polymerase sigma factor [Frankia sp. Cppng1_Ct_nod]